jgi:hypothetical protein
MFRATPEFTKAATLMSNQVLQGAITRLAEKYGFDADEAFQFLHGQETEQVPPSPSTSILSCAHWSNTKAFKKMKDKETQKKYYARMGASPDVLQLVELDSKPYGSEAEKIISEIFGLGPRTSTQNDATFHGKKIEIKSARYWAGKDNCVWQHLEPDHDYEYALLALLDFHGWKVWGIKKSLLMGEMREKNIVTFQGKQGWWTRKSDLLPYLTPIMTMEDLQAFVL